MNIGGTLSLQPLFWRALESPFLRNVASEFALDFYGRLVSPGLTARRIFARVSAVRDEARDVKSFELRPNGHYRGFRAGQHVNVFVEIHGVRHVRCYSPSNAPDSGRLVLTIKRHPGGLVSEWFHDHVRVGDWVEVGKPFGDFTLPGDAPRKLLFIAGGSGITPVASLLRSLKASGVYDVRLLAYAQNYEDFIFADELQTAALQNDSLSVHFAVTREAARSGDLAGHFAPDHLERVAKDASERMTFVCGPSALIRSVRDLWAHRRFPIEPKTETFAPAKPAEGLDTGAQARVEVTAALAGRTFSATSGASLLAQAERAGFFPPNGCRQGICFTCACRKRLGTVRNITTGAVSSEPDEQIRLCVSEPLSDITLDL